MALQPCAKNQYSRTDHVPWTLSACTRERNAMMLHARRELSLPHMSMQACPRCRQWLPSMVAPAERDFTRPAALGMLPPAGGMLRSGSWTDHWYAADQNIPGQASLLSQQRSLWSAAVASRL